MLKEAEKELARLNPKPNNIFPLKKVRRKDSKGIEEERCRKGKDAKLAFGEKDRKEGLLHDSS